jgi:RNA polymerase sigma-70 factor (ECF subfamily)
MRASQPPLQDPEAFSNLYTTTQIIIFRFIYGMHGGPVEEVEDLTCDTFMRAWKGRERFFGDDHEALCWLFTIARHLVIDAHRRRKTHLDNTDVLLDDASIDAIYISSQVTPEEQAASREQFKRLWQVLQNLPDDKREMLVLRYMLGWKVKQIAEYLQKEENTVSVNIRRCLEQIRQGWSVD